MRKLIVALCLIQALLVAGCGGGSTVIAGGSSPTQTIANPGTNVATMIVDAGPGPSFNAVDTPYVSVTICVPGTSTCQTINHVEVDTGSYGFRVLSEALAISLPAETNAAGNPLAECTQFVDGFSWGLLATADVQIAGESAANVPVQVIGDPSISGDSSFPAIPAACQNTGTAEDTIAAFGANGILGIGLFVQDCGYGCTVDASAGLYYACPSASTCAGTTMPLLAQVTNPVTRFPTDNNGVIIELPAVPATGAASAAGALVFGIGTEGNNSLAGNATVLTADPGTGDVSTSFNGATLPKSYFDTGSNAYYFADSAIATCASGTSAPGFFCPPAELTFSATNSGETSGGQPTGVSAPVTFYIDNADTLLNDNPTFTAFDDFGAPNSDTSSFDFGLPFFLGRNVYVAIENANTPGGVGPYFAY